jgi:hypothetical protein
MLKHEKNISSFPQFNHGNAGEIMLLLKRELRLLCYFTIHIINK